MSNKLMIQNELACMKNQRLNDIGRAGNMLWLGIGREIQITDRKDNIRTLSTFSLHVQCPWIFVFEDEIIVASSDFYIPDSKTQENEFLSLRDTFGKSRFDEKIKELQLLIKKLDVYVVYIEAESFGKLKIIFSEGFQMEIYPDSSARREFWRFFTNVPDSQHFVVFEE